MQNEQALLHAAQRRPEGVPHQPHRGGRRTCGRGLPSADGRPSRDEGRLRQVRSCTLEGERTPAADRNLGGEVSKSDVKLTFKLSDEVADYLIDMLNTEISQVAEDLREHVVNNHTGHESCKHCKEYQRQLSLAEEAYDTLRSLDGANGDTYHDNPLLQDTPGVEGDGFRWTETNQR